MTHKERVQTALSGEQPDRCPLQVSFTPEFARRLSDHLGKDEGRSHNPHGGGNTYRLERAIDNDVLITSVGWANSYYQNEDDSYTDEWGIGWRSVQYMTPFGAGRYTEVCNRPLADNTAIASYAVPDATRASLYEPARLLVQECGADYWITGATVCTVFETAWALRGLDRMLMDLALDPETAERILDIPFRYHLEAARRLVALGVDMIWTGDDVGTQTGMLIAPDMWRRFLKPLLARFFSELKSMNPRLKIAYHSDGDIRPIIPDLIEIGLDVLNPVQPACMNPAELKRTYGRNLCYWGTIDEQHTLPFGTPQDVKAEVETRLRTVGRGGGLIIGPTHHVQMDTPMENLLALVDSVRSLPYGASPARGAAGA
ncbi:MAG: uroporphyrinogen decarboxylase family protein [Spirochaetia bacterium]